VSELPRKSEIPLARFHLGELVVMPADDVARMMLRTGHLNRLQHSQRNHSAPQLSPVSIFDHRAPPPAFHKFPALKGRPRFSGGVWGSGGILRIHFIGLITKHNASGLVPRPSLEPMFISLADFMSLFCALFGVRQSKREAYYVQISR